MLADISSSAIVAVADLTRARAFYRDTLGLPLADESDSVLVFRTGATELVVYRSEQAGTNRANAVVWDAGGEFDAIIGELRARGITFEHYPELGMAIEGDVHVVDGFRAAWFRDPDGNILHINSGN